MTATTHRSLQTGILGAILLISAALLHACSGDAAEDPRNATSKHSDPAQLVFLFQRQRDPSQTRESADAAAAFLSDHIGIPVKAVVPGDYAASVQALVSEQADVAYVSALPFLLARRDAGARILVAEVRADASGEPRTDYDSVWVTRDDSDLHTFADVTERAASLRVSFTSRTSTSGYIMANLRLVREGILRPKQDPSNIFRAVAYAGGYTQALHEVLARRADLCAVSFYTVEGPTADIYTTPEERAQLRILARTPGVPTHLVCVRAGISEDLSQRITDALLALSEERPELLANVYGATQFRTVDEDSHISAAIEAMEALGLPIDNFVR